MSEVPPLPNLFAVQPGLPTELGTQSEVYSSLGYEQGRNLTIWTSTEHVVDYVDQGGFRRATEDLTRSLHKWMSETPSPKVLLCGSRGGRLVSRVIAEGQAIPPLLALNSMLYYLFVPEDQFDKLQFNIAFEAKSLLRKGASDLVNPVPSSVAPRTVLTSSPLDAFPAWPGCWARILPALRFMPDDLLRAAAHRLHDVHVYYNEANTHDSESFIQSHEHLGALLRLAAHGAAKAETATRGIVDSQLSKGASVCGLWGDSSHVE
mmetsp:Transcript_165740/g.318240  ORF Transcript_165740/g.318240 Transcript_165740/m.318240 type:complete len:263 (-) Transcript_165740:38-826(-)